MGNALRCIEASNFLYRRVRLRPELKDRGIFIVNDRKGYMFRLRFTRHEGCVSGIYGMVISISPDAYGNRGGCEREYPSTIETCLLREILLSDSGYPDIYKADFLYDDDEGYYDVRSFKNADKLVEEIIRIADFLLPPSQV